MTSIYFVNGRQLYVFQMEDNPKFVCKLQMTLMFLEMRTDYQIYQGYQGKKIYQGYQIKNFSKYIKDMKDGK
jgi:hypothetical protein